jgi:sterol desaturase/sphingolipid hydroxylase (fatty acid hydroxylase superfamily)
MMKHEMTATAVALLFVYIYGRQVLWYFLKILVFEKYLAAMRFFRTAKLSKNNDVIEKKSQIVLGLTTVLIASAVAVMARWVYLNGYLRVYMHISDYGPLYFILSVFIYCLAYDLLFYLSHRSLHRPVFYDRIHSVHHQIVNTNIYAVAHFHPAETLLYSLCHIFILLFLPMHPLAVYAALILTDIQNTFLHWGFDFVTAGAKPYFSWWASSAHHHFHHIQNKGNFGYFTRFWDYLFQTDSGETVK